MVFGTRDVRSDLGVFSSEKCSACKDSYSYRFIKITRYIVILFMNLIPIGSHYEAVCEGCEDVLAVDGRAGAGIAKKNFGKAHRALNLKTFLKLAAAVLIVAAAVALPLTVRFPLDRRPETIKSLVSEDGLYTIQSADGDILGVVQIAEGESKLTYYDDISILTGEPGADGRFTKHEYRQEATNETEQDDLFLVRIPDNPGILEDNYGTAVRIYHYDTANDALGYSRGVPDLSAITYESNKITYPFMFYSGQEEPKPYFLVLYLDGDKQYEATFIPEVATGETNQFVMLTKREYIGGRVASETVYNFDADTIAKASQSGLTQESSLQDILGFIEQNTTDAYMSTSFEYYKNTKVISKMSLSMQDANGEIQTASQGFTVIEKNGYYIVQAAQEEQ